jgi:hypothetical protein
MRKSLMILLTLLAISTCAFASAASAEVIEWAGHGYHLAGGQNGFLNHKVSIKASDVLATSEAIGCAGIREVVPVSCEEFAGSGAGVVLLNAVTAEPDLHNHSTFEGTFRGFYEP